MKICLPSDSKQSIGGGWSFRRNLIKGLGAFPQVSVVESIAEADVCVIAGPTMVTRNTIETIKAGDKKLVVRLDNVPRNSRNRNTGTSRLKDFAQAADEVVWQCNWARDYLYSFVGRGGVVIYNGVDTDVFATEGAYKDFKGDPVFLYSRFNRDENKRWEEAWFKYQGLQKKHADARLVVVGKFSDEQRQYNFDFFQGETVEYMGIISEPKEMAAVYRGCDRFLATYYNDCYSNTYLEALACGVELWEPSMSGGTPELIKNGVIDLPTMAGEYVKLFEKVLIDD